MQRKHLNRGERRGRPSRQMGWNSGTLEQLSYLQSVHSKPYVQSMWITRRNQQLHPFLHGSVSPSRWTDPCRIIGVCNLSQFLLSWSMLSFICLGSQRLFRKLWDAITGCNSIHVNLERYLYFFSRSRIPLESAHMLTPLYKPLSYYSKLKKPIPDHSTMYDAQWLLTS